MWTRYAAATLACLTWLLACPDEASSKDPPPLNELSLEVAALQTVYALNLTRPQMVELKKIAAETADRSPGRQKAKGSDKLRQALADLRSALVAAANGERIEKLVKQIDDIREKEKPELDDGVEVTEAAREKAPDVLRMLSAGQVAAYCGGIASEIGDPTESLLDALAAVRGLKGAEWQQLRDGVSEQVGRLVGGVDPEEAQAVADKVVQFLIVVRSLSDAEFKKQRPELEKSARELVRGAGPFEVLRHVMERALAELLSNPRLAEALDARLRVVEVRRPRAGQPPWMFARTRSRSGTTSGRP